MKERFWISLLFLLAAVYDGVLGLLFLAAPYYMFDRYEVTRPNHPGYVQFPAMLLIIFALMFLVIAIRPVTNRHLIVYGILLKLAYCGITSWYWVTTPSESIPNSLPFMWKPFVVIDLVTAVLFIWAYVSLRRLGKSGT